MYLPRQHWFPCLRVSYAHVTLSNKHGKSWWKYTNHMPFVNANSYCYGLSTCHWFLKSQVLGFINFNQYVLNSILSLMFHVTNFLCICRVSLSNSLESKFLIWLLNNKAWQVKELRGLRKTFFEENQQLMEKVTGLEQKIQSIEERATSHENLTEKMTKVVFLCQLFSINYLLSLLINYLNFVILIWFAISWTIPQQWAIPITQDRLNLD